VNGSARELESGRLAGVDSAVPAEVPLSLFLTEATEGHLAFGAGTLVQVRLAAWLGLSGQPPVRPERFSHIGTRFIRVVLTNSGKHRGCCGTPLWVEHPTGEQRGCRAWKGQRPPGGSRVYVAVARPCASADR
jgi:hypothetical protein